MPKPDKPEVKIMPIRMPVYKSPEEYQKAVEQNLKNNPALALIISKVDVLEKKIDAVGMRLMAQDNARSMERFKGLYKS